MRDICFLQLILEGKIGGRKGSVERRCHGFATSNSGQE